MKHGLRCKKCGAEIFSKSHHDFKTCTCGACFVDGGKDYFKYGGDIKDFEIINIESSTQDVDKKDK